MSEEITPVLIVGTGNVTLDGGKPGVRVHRINADGTLGAPCYFDRKSKVMRPANVGSIYEVDTSNDGTTFHAGLRYKKPWPDEAQVLVWRADSDLVLGRERAAKDRKAGEKEVLDRAMASLNPLRKLYQQTDRIGRRLLLVQVMEYIQRNTVDVN